MSAKGPIDLWELYQTGASGPLRMGASSPEEVVAELGDPGKNYRVDPYGYRCLDYGQLEVWLADEPAGLWYVKALPPLFHVSVSGGAVRRDVDPLSWIPITARRWCSKARASRAC